MNFRGGVAGEADLDDRAQATGVVRECTKEGPLSLSGIGYWWSCEVEITTKDGDTADQVFKGSQFVPDDKGTEFPLASAGRQSGAWARADIPGHNWAIIVTAGGFLAGAVCLIVGVRRLMGRLGLRFELSGHGVGVGAFGAVVGPAAVLGTPGAAVVLHCGHRVVSGVRHQP